MKMLRGLNFRTQITASFAAIILFVAAMTLTVMHVILRDSYREQESAVLETHGRQIAINIDNRLEYFVSYLQLLSRDPQLVKAMEEQDFQNVRIVLERATDEFWKLNSGRVSAIRMYRSGVYTTIAGLGDTSDIFRSFAPGGEAYPQNILITGTYLNNRNEKVFSVFRKVYQTNMQREYYLEICIYETEIFGFFNEDNSGNAIYIFHSDSLVSMNDRESFSRLLYAQRENDLVVVPRDKVGIPERDIVISERSELGLDVLIETNTQYLDKGYVTILVRMLPVLIGMVFAAFILAALLSARMNKRLKSLQEKIIRVSDWNLDEKLHIDGHDEFSNLANELDETRIRILELIEQNSCTSELMRVAEMRALRAQINSHFLFNSLSSIKWLARKDDPETLAEAVDSLAQFLRYSLAIKENQVLLLQEVQQLEAYIHLQRLRYGDELNIRIDIDVALMNYKTVRLILQPLVENAIYHGRRTNGSTLNITIYSYEDDRYYYLMVEDDGNGIAPEILRKIQQGEEDISQSGYGLRNVINRVQMCLGSTSDEIIKIESRQNLYTNITIRQPK